MSYFFLGSDEGLWSLYTILALLLIVHACLKGVLTLPVKACVYLLWIALAVVLSYLQSRIGYSMGMFAMIYNIAMAIVIVTTLTIDQETIVSFLPKIASLQLVAYVGMLLINGHFDGYGFSVSERVNHNTFGTSVAIISVILFVKIVFFGEGAALYKFFWALSLVLIIVSGSRNALLAMILTSVIVYMVAQTHQGKTLSGGLKFLVVACALVLAGGLVLPEIGIDLSRYDYVELIESGGSNRSIIWETLSPVIWRDYKWFGYGPGHFCSEEMIHALMDLDYTHTHNTIFEAWGELGFFGLIPFALILIYAFRRGLSHIKHESGYLMFGFVLVVLLLLGLGESLFANIELWIIIGLLFGIRTPDEEIEEEQETEHVEK
jgi:O-antigen ligase